MKKELEEARKGGEVIPFQQTPLATAPTPPGDDWLRRLPNETRFVAKPRNYKGAWLGAYGVAAKLPECILIAVFHEGTMAMHWVDSAIFSRDHIHVATIPEEQLKGEPQKVAEEERDE